MGLPMVGVHTGSELSRTSFFANYSDGSYDQRVFFDSSGNRYLFNNNTKIIKFNSKNQIIWQRTVGGNIGPTNSYVDSSGNIYISGERGSSPTPYAVLLKISTSGSIVWQKEYPLSDSSQSGSYVYSDSSGNVYAGYWYGPSNNDYADIVKYNSSGVLQWRVRLSYSTIYYNARPGDINVDSSGNVYVGAHTYNTQGVGWESYAIKLNSSGSVLWQKKIYGSDSFYISGSTSIDSSGYIYFTGFKGYMTPYMVKMDSSGNIIWQKQAQYSSGNFLVCNKHTFDGTNFYQLVWGTRNGVETYNLAWIVSISQAGNINLQRSISFDGAAVYAYGINTDSSHMYCAGYGAFKWDIKVPKNGTKTGVYPGIGHTLTYQASNISYISSDASITSGGLSISSLSATVTDATATLADNNGTYSIRTF